MLGHVEELVARTATVPPDVAIASTIFSAKVVDQRIITVRLHQLAELAAGTTEMTPAIVRGTE